MNILGYTNPEDLLEAVKTGRVNLPENKESQEEINQVLEKRYCNSCEKSQCNYCPVYAIYNKLDEVD